MGSLISASGLRFSYGQTPALANASAALDEGEVLALIGPSGSGKTTFLYCLAGILRPDEGSITFDGQDLAALTSEELARLRRQRYGFVFQFAELVPELSLRENIELPLLLNGHGRRSSKREATALIERLNLGESADRRPAHVSGGQAQRAAVCRALAHQPSVIFADEPTGALDSVNGHEVLKALGDVSRERGNAVVIVSHDSAVVDIADRVVHFHDGMTGGS